MTQNPLPPFDCLVNKNHSFQPGASRQFGFLVSEQCSRRRKMLQRQSLLNNTKDDFESSKKSTVTRYKNQAESFKEAASKTSSWRNDRRLRISTDKM